MNNLIFLFLAANPRQVIQPLGVFLRLEFTEIINVNKLKWGQSKFEGIKVECELWPTIFMAAKFL